MLSVATWAYAAGLMISEPGWHAPAGCPTQSEVDALLLEEHADVDPEVVASSSVNAVVTRLDDGSWQVSVRVETGSAQVRRVLRLDSCEAAAEATALVYGLALGDAMPTEERNPPPPIAPETLIPPPDGPAPETPTAPSAPKEPPVDVAPTLTMGPRPAAPTEGTRDRRPWSGYRGAASIGVGLRAAALPRATLALLAGGEVRVGPLRFGSTVDYGFARSFEVPQTDAGGDLSTLVASLSVGVPLEWNAIWTPSVAVRGGGVFGQGRGGDAHRQRWVPWWLLAVGLDASWPPRSRWAVRVGASLEVPLVSHTFTFDSALLGKTGPAGVRAWLGPLIRFGKSPASGSAPTR